MRKMEPEDDREQRRKPPDLQLIVYEVKTEVAKEALGRALELLARWALRRRRKG